MKNLIIIAMLALFAGCRTPQPVTPTKVLFEKEKTEVRHRLDSVSMPGDSASVRASFYCDSLNQVRLREIDELKGKNTSSSTSFENGELKVKIKFIDRIVYVPGVDSLIYREKEVPVPVPGPVQIVNELHWWQTALMWVGSIALILIIGYLLFKFAARRV